MSDLELCCMSDLELCCMFEEETDPDTEQLLLNEINWRIEAMRREAGE